MPAMIENILIYVTNKHVTIENLMERSRETFPYIIQCLKRNDQVAAAATTM